MKQLQKKILLHHVAQVSRVTLGLSLFCLVFIALSHFVKAITLTEVSNTDGIPASWSITNSRPDTITVPVTYFDQVQDNLMFEANLNGKPIISGAHLGLVQKYLSGEGLPVPTYANNTEGELYIGDRNLYVNKANFHQWFHEVEGKSWQYDSSIVFHRQGNTNKYTYDGGDGSGEGLQVFPLDNVNSPIAEIICVTIEEDQECHNYHFTMKMRVPIRVNATGAERFDFSGDDDVWVFLNNQLVLDLGGLHTRLPGYFAINEDGTVSSGLTDKNGYIQPQLQDANINLKKGEVTNIDFFYAERNTSRANILITITGMDWPINADSNLTSQLIGNKYVEYNASFKNRDLDNPVTLTHLASHLIDSDATNTNVGFIPFNLSDNILRYSTDGNTWHDLAVSAPSTSLSGFQLSTPLTVNPGETIYFRYNVAPTKNQINYENTLSLYYYSTHNNQRHYNISSASTSIVASHLEAVEEANYRIFFDSNGGTPIPTQVVAPGETATVPLPPTHYNHDYTFHTWSVLNGGWYDFNTPVYGDVYLVADWGNSIGSDDEEPIAYSCTNYLERLESYNYFDFSSEDGATPSYDFNYYWLQHNCTGQETPGEPEPEPDIPPIPPDPDPDPDPDPEPEPQPPVPEPDPNPPVPDPDPENPEDFIYDNPDDFLPVLGETLLVPDTGVITNLSATPFGNESFASIIMSQPFALINLAVFAISFSVFFPIRKY
ncbi:fibro-slime domain-containing protein [Candidatus Saccharibacteria bacterium]|nr:fibro-slime domain-containing protein [Candidatus Saccharibacteria bacterium]